MILKHFPLQLFVSIHKTKLDQTRWQNWQRLHQRSVDWAQFDKDVIVEENGSLSSGQIAAINKYTLTQHNFAVEVKDGGKTFLMALQPIIDAGKHNVGNLIIFQNITESKADFWMSMTFIVLLGSISGTGIFILFFIILRNVNHMIKANEVVIQASLNEKVVLLQEIHHRVKNNLQVVSSMLSLQASTETDSHATEVLKEGERRIRVMARVHENLYRSDDLSHISSRQYLGAIIDDLHQSSLDKVARVLLQHDIDDINLTIDQATPIGQITSELISNAQKHAFPHERTGTINVSLKRMNTGEIELAISDNGIGMPEGRGLTGYKSLGLRLVNALAQNLGGTVILERENGTRVSIVFRGECV
ncbi:MAG: hypothetical protein JKY92_05220 [Magnetovibrio sp.]|nr:hypothetical protein [Magnetovibrio sp.]